MTTESFIKGLIIGGVAGLAVGMLYAPKSGEGDQEANIRFNGGNIKQSQDTV